MKRVLLAIAVLLSFATSARAQNYAACQVNGIITVCPDDVRLKTGKFVQNSYVNWAAPGALGSGTATTVRGTTITATTQFTGSGAGLTNVPAASLAGTVNCASLTCQNIANAALVNSSLTVTAGTGLTGGGGVSLGGSVALAVAYGSTAGTATQGNDARLPPAPTAANKLLYDTGIEYAETAACGTAGTMLIGGSPPSCSDSGSLAAQLTTPKVTSTGQLAVNAATANNVTLGVNNTAVVTVGAAGVTAAQPLAMSGQKITGVGTPAAASTDAATAAYAEAQKTGGLVTIATFNQSNTWSANNYAGPLGMSEGGFAAASGPTPASIPVAGVLSHCYTTVRTVTSSTPVYAVHRAATGSNTYAATGITMTQGAFDKWTFDNTHTFAVTAGDTFVVKNDTAYGGPGFIMQCQFVPN